MGRKKGKAKECYNCTNLPMFKFGEKDFVIEKFPPPELHLLTGLFNHMYNGMLENCELKNCAEKWAENAGVDRTFCPSLSFVGNHCIRLLKNIDLLLETNPPRSVHKVRLDSNF